MKQMPRAGQLGQKKRLEAAKMALQKEKVCILCPASIFHGHFLSLSIAIPRQESSQPQPTERLDK
jgi:hypothetical protein